MNKKIMFGFGIAFFLMASMPFVSALQAETVSVNETPAITSQTINPENDETDLIKQALLEISEIKLMLPTMTESIGIKQIEAFLNSYSLYPPDCRGLHNLLDFIYYMYMYAISHLYKTVGWWYNFYHSWKDIYEFRCGDYYPPSFDSNIVSLTNSKCPLCTPYN